MSHLQYFATILAAVALATVLSEPAGAERQTASRRASRMVEIRSYNLKPGTRDRFHQLFLKEALPMLSVSNDSMIRPGTMNAP